MSTSATSMHTTTTRIRHLAFAGILLSALQPFSSSAFSAVADDATQAKRDARRAARSQAAAATTNSGTAAATTTSGTAASSRAADRAATATARALRPAKSAPTAPIPAAVPVPARPVKTYLPPHPWGVYSSGGHPLTDKYLPENAAEVRGFPLSLKWSAIEPEQGKYAFEKEIRAPLEEAKRRGVYVHFMIPIAPNNITPRWIYEKGGVPEVKVPERLSPQRKVQNLIFPYYFDPRFQKILRATIKAVGDYIAALPDDLKQRIVFVQMAEGSTGDGGPYKGEPLDPKYYISRDDWHIYRLNLWTYYQSVFQRADGSLAIPLLVNGNENRGGEHAWLLKHCDNFGIKNGMFGHGYLVGDAIERLEVWEKLRAKVTARGHQIFSRCEQDGEWNVCGWAKKNPPAALYWGALFALHNKLDIWNMQSAALITQPIGEALRIFNRYAGCNEPSPASPGAFCALRRGLNAADTKTFPESKYGQAEKKNIARYLAIVKDFAHLGAVQEDPPKATGGNMENRQADGQNDAGWNILPGNLERFLTQLRPEETSVAMWHLDAHPYSQFTRRFDAATGRTRMTFRLADQFFADPAAPNPMSIRVAYLDKGAGEWELVYATAAGEKVARRVANTNSGEWRDLKLTLADAVWNHRLAGGGDLALRHVGGTDTTFHIIELARSN